MSKEYPELLPVIQADRNLCRLLLGLPESNRARRLQGEAAIDPLQLLARHRIDGQEEMRRALADAADAALAFLTRLEADQERERPYDDIEACATDASDWQAKDLLCERDELRRLIRDLRCVSAKAPALHTPEEKDNG